MAALEDEQRYSGRKTLGAGDPRRRQYGCRVHDNQQQIGRRRPLDRRVVGRRRQTADSTK